MFDFEKLQVYQKSLDYTEVILDFLKSKTDLDLFLSDQLKRSSISVSINIAEGAGRLGKRDKRHFYVISKSSAFETVAILQIIQRRYEIDQDFYIDCYNRVDEIVKMLHGLIRNLE